jgi:phosphopantothenoylcysteine decarboxylase/phosphopantothenate--cysteine ligase
MDLILLRAANFGASVILVSGPTHLQVSHLLIKVINVVSAEEMYDTCQLYYNDVDVAISRSSSRL